MHQISRALPEVDPFFSIYYCDGLLERKIFDFLIEAARVTEEKVSEGRLVVPA